MKVNFLTHGNPTHMDMLVIQYKVLGLGRDWVGLGVLHAALGLGLQSLAWPRD